MWKKELLFFEQNVIEGHITASQQGNFLYSPQNEKRDIPLFEAYPEENVPDNWRR